MSRVMQNNRLLVVLVGLLFISNIAILFYFLSWNKSPRSSSDRGAGGRGSVVGYVQKKLGLDSLQTGRYRTLYEQHHDSLKVLGEANRKARLALFNLLQQPDVTDSAVLQAAHIIGASQEAIELNNFRHFQRVRSLCRGDQVSKFDSMVIRMVNRPPGGRNNGPRNNDKPPTNH